MHRIIRNVFWSISIGFCLLAGFHWLTIDQYTPVRWFAYLMPWSLALFLPAIIFASRIHDYRLLTILMLSTIYVVCSYLPNFLKKDELNISSPVIKVMTYNVWSKNADMPAAAKVILDAEPDIALLQEITPQQFAELDKILKSSKQGHHLLGSYSEKELLAVLSRYPLKPLSTPDTSRYRVQKVGIETVRGFILVYNVHFLRGSYVRRTDAVETLLLQRIAQDAHPVILGGDFNTTAETMIYRRLVNNMQNSHDAAGFGFGFTYPTGASILPAWLRFPGLVRIDHIFYSDHLRAASSVVLKDSGGSDHFPVLAELIEMTF